MITTMKLLIGPIVLASLVLGTNAVLPTNSTEAQGELSLQSIDGRSISLDSLRGKVVVLLFSGVQDPQCRDEFKALNSLSERYQGKEVAIYWVSVNPLSAASDERLRNPCGATGAVTVLRDPAQSVFKRFGGSARQLPTTVVISKLGQPQGPPKGGFNPGSDFVNDVAATIDTSLK